MGLSDTVGLIARRRIDHYLTVCLIIGHTFGARPIFLGYSLLGEDQVPLEGPARVHP